MDRSCRRCRESRPRQRDTIRLCRHGHRQQLALRLLANTEGSLTVLVSPLEHLVRIYSMLTGHSGNRSSRDKRGFYDATLLLPCSSQPFQGRGRCLNCIRIAHRVSVGQKNPAVYTAKSGFQLPTIPDEELATVVEIDSASSLLLTG
jgi:hypothetical protein